MSGNTQEESEEHERVFNACMHVNIDAFKKEAYKAALLPDKDTVKGVREVWKKLSGEAKNFVKEGWEKNGFNLIPADDLVDLELKECPGLGSDPEVSNDQLQAMIQGYSYTPTSPTQAQGRNVDPQKIDPQKIDPQKIDAKMPRTACPIGAPAEAPAKAEAPAEAPVKAEAITVQWLGMRPALMHAQDKIKEYNQKDKDKYGGIGGYTWYGEGFDSMNPSGLPKDELLLFFVRYWTTVEDGRGVIHLMLSDHEADLLPAFPTHLLLQQLCGHDPNSEPFLDAIVKELGIADSEKRSILAQCAYAAVTGVHTVLKINYKLSPQGSSPQGSSGSDGRKSGEIKIVHQIQGAFRAVRAVGWVEACYRSALLSSLTQDDMATHKVDPGYGEQNRAEALFGDKIHEWMKESPSFKDVMWRDLARRTVDAYHANGGSPVLMSQWVQIVPLREVEDPLDREAADNWKGKINDLYNNEPEKSPLRSVLQHLKRATDCVADNADEYMRAVLEPEKNGIYTLCAQVQAALHTGLVPMETVWESGKSNECDHMRLGVMQRARDRLIVPEIEGVTLNRSDLEADEAEDMRLAEQVVAARVASLRRVYERRVDMDGPSRPLYAEAVDVLSVAGITGAGQWTDPDWLIGAAKSCTWGSVSSTVDACLAAVRTCGEILDQRLKPAYYKELVAEYSTSAGVAGSANACVIEANKIVKERQRSECVPDDRINRVFQRLAVKSLEAWLQCNINVDADDNQMLKVKDVLYEAVNATFKMCESVSDMSSSLYDDVDEERVQKVHEVLAHCTRYFLLVMCIADRKTGRRDLVLRADRILLRMGIVLEEQSSVVGSRGNSTLPTLLTDLEVKKKRQALGTNLDEIEVVLKTDYIKQLARLPPDAQAEPGTPDNLQINWKDMCNAFGLVEGVSDANAQMEAGAKEEEEEEEEIRAAACIHAAFFGANSVLKLDETKFLDAVASVHMDDDTLVWNTALTLLAASCIAHHLIDDWKMQDTSNDGKTEQDCVLHGLAIAYLGMAGMHPEGKFLLLEEQIGEAFAVPSRLAAQDAALAVVQTFGSARVRSAWIGMAMAGAPVSMFFYASIEKVDFLPGILHEPAYDSAAILASQLFTSKSTLTEDDLHQIVRVTVSVNMEKGELVPELLMEPSGAGAAPADEYVLIVKSDAAPITVDNALQDLVRDTMNAPGAVNDGPAPFSHHFIVDGHVLIRTEDAERYGGEIIDGGEIIVRKYTALHDLCKAKTETPADTQVLREPTTMGAVAQGASIPNYTSSGAHAVQIGAGEAWLSRQNITHLATIIKRIDLWSKIQNMLPGIYRRLPAFFYVPSSAHRHWNKSSITTERLKEIYSEGMHFNRVECEDWIRQWVSPDWMIYQGDNQRESIIYEGSRMQRVQGNHNELFKWIGKRRTELSDKLNDYIFNIKHTTFNHDSIKLAIRTYLNEISLKFWESELCSEIATGREKQQMVHNLVKHTLIGNSKYDAEIHHQLSVDNPGLNTDYLRIRRTSEQLEKFVEESNLAEYYLEQIDYLKRTYRHLSDSEVQPFLTLGMPIGTERAINGVVANLEKFCIWIGARHICNARNKDVLRWLIVLLFAMMIQEADASGLIMGGSISTAIFRLAWKKYVRSGDTPQYNAEDQVNKVPFMELMFRLRMRNHLENVAPAHQDLKNREVYKRMSLLIGGALVPFLLQAVNLCFNNGHQQQLTLKETLPLASDEGDIDTRWEKVHNAYSTLSATIPRMITKEAQNAMEVLDKLSQAAMTVAKLQYSLRGLEGVPLGVKWSKIFNIWQQNLFMSIRSAINGRTSANVRTVQTIHELFESLNGELIEDTMEPIKKQLEAWPDRMGKNDTDLKKIRSKMDGLYPKLNNIFEDVTAYLKKKEAPDDFMNAKHSSLLRLWAAWSLGEQLGDDKSGLTRCEETYQQLWKLYVQPGNQAQLYQGQKSSFLDYAQEYWAWLQYGYAYVPLLVPGLLFSAGAPITEWLRTFEMVLFSTKQMDAAFAQTASIISLGGPEGLIPAALNFVDDLDVPGQLRAVEAGFNLLDHYTNAQFVSLGATFSFPLALWFLTGTNRDWFLEFSKDMIETKLPIFWSSVMRYILPFVARLIPSLTGELDFHFSPVDAETSSVDPPGNAWGEVIRLLYENSLVTTVKNFTGGHDDTNFIGGHDYTVKIIGGVAALSALALPVLYLKKWTNKQQDKSIDSTVSATEVGSSVVDSCGGVLEWNGEEALNLLLHWTRAGKYPTITGRTTQVYEVQVDEAEKDLKTIHGWAGVREEEEVDITHAITVATPDKNIAGRTNIIITAKLSALAFKYFLEFVNDAFDDTNPIGTNQLLKDAFHDESVKRYSDGTSGSKTFQYLITNLKDNATEEDWRENWQKKWKKALENYMKNAAWCPSRCEGLCMGEDVLKAHINVNGITDVQLSPKFAQLLAHRSLMQFRMGMSAVLLRERTDEESDGHSIIRKKQTEMLKKRVKKLKKLLQKCTEKLVNPTHDREITDIQELFEYTKAAACFVVSLTGEGSYTLSSYEPVHMYALLAELILCKEWIPDESIKVYKPTVGNGANPIKYIKAVDPCEARGSSITTYIKPTLRSEPVPGPGIPAVKHMLRPPNGTDRDKSNVSSGSITVLAEGESDKFCPKAIRSMQACAHIQGLKDYTLEFNDPTTTGRVLHTFFKAMPFFLLSSTPWFENDKAREIFSSNNNTIATRDFNPVMQIQQYTTLGPGNWIGLISKVSEGEQEHLLNMLSTFFYNVDGFFDIEELTRSAAGVFNYQQLRTVHKITSLRKAAATLGWGYLNHRQIQQSTGEYYVMYESGWEKLDAKDKKEIEVDNLLEHMLKDLRYDESFSLVNVKLGKDKSSQVKKYYAVKDDEFKPEIVARMLYIVFNSGNVHVELPRDKDTYGVTRDAFIDFIVSKTDSKQWTGIDKLSIKQYLKAAGQMPWEGSTGSYTIPNNNKQVQEWLNKLKENVRFLYDASFQTTDKMIKETYSGDSLVTSPLLLVPKEQATFKGQKKPHTYDKENAILLKQDNKPRYFQEYMLLKSEVTPNDILRRCMRIFGMDAMYEFLNRGSTDAIFQDEQWKDTILSKIKEDKRFLSLLDAIRQMFSEDRLDLQSKAVTYIRYFACASEVCVSDTRKQQEVDIKWLQKLIKKSEIKSWKSETSANAFGYISNAASGAFTSIKETFKPDENAYGKITDLFGSISDPLVYEMLWLIWRKFTNVDDWQSSFFLFCTAGIRHYIRDHTDTPITVQTPSGGKLREVSVDNSIHLQFFYLTSFVQMLLKDIGLDNVWDAFKEDKEDKSTTNAVFNIDNDLLNALRGDKKYGRKLRRNYQSQGWLAWKRSLKACEDIVTGIGTKIGRGPQNDRESNPQIEFYAPDEDMHLVGGEYEIKQADLLEVNDKKLMGCEGLYYREAGDVAMLKREIRPDSKHKEKYSISANALRGLTKGLEGDRDAAHLPLGVSWRDRKDFRRNAAFVYKKPSLPRPELDHRPELDRVYKTVFIESVSTLARIMHDDFSVWNIVECLVIGGVGPKEVYNKKCLLEEAAALLPWCFVSDTANLHETISFVQLLCKSKTKTGSADNTKERVNDLLKAPPPGDLDEGDVYVYRQTGKFARHLFTGAYPNA